VQGDADLAPRIGRTDVTLRRGVPDGVLHQAFLRVDPVS
jgi:hypothetical protein